MPDKHIKHVMSDMSEKKKDKKREKGRRGEEGEREREREIGRIKTKLAPIKHLKRKFISTTELLRWFSRLVTIWRVSCVHLH